jgi:hypothetical protein
MIIQKQKAREVSPGFDPSRVVGFTSSYPNSQTVTAGTLVVLLQQHALERLMANTDFDLTRWPGECQISTGRRPQPAAGSGHSAVVRPWPCVRVQAVGCSLDKRTTGTIHLESS